MLESESMLQPGTYGLNTRDLTVPADAQGTSRFGSTMTNVVIQNGELESRKAFIGSVTGYPSNQIYRLGIFKSVVDDINDVFIAHGPDAASGPVHYVSNGVWNLIAGGSGAVSAKFAKPISFDKYLFHGIGASPARPFAGAARYSKFSGGIWQFISAVSPSANGTDWHIGYGRSWFTDEHGTVYWSNLNNPQNFSSGDSGSIDLLGVLPKKDKMVATRAAFGRIFFFSRYSILMYTFLGSAGDPAFMELTDTYDERGCISANSIQIADDGIYFLSDDGLFRINRLGTIAKQMEIVEVSGLYKDELLSTMEQTQQFIPTALNSVDRGPGVYPNTRSIYWAEQGWYLLSFPSASVTLCVHTKVPVSDGETTVPAATFWTGSGLTLWDFEVDSAGTLYAAAHTGTSQGVGSSGIYVYSGYTPDNASQAYTMTYATQWLNNRDESQLKHYKQLTSIFEGVPAQSGTVSWYLGYDEDTARSETVTLDSTEFAENPGPGKVTFTMGGSSVVLKVKYAFPINGNRVAIKQVRPYFVRGATKK